MSTHQFEVEPGLHTITASATGYITQQRTVDVQHDMTVSMELQRIVSPTSPTSDSIGPLVGIGIASAAILLLVLFITRSD